MDFLSKAKIVFRSGSTNFSPVNNQNVDYVGAYVVATLKPLQKYLASGKRGRTQKKPRNPNDDRKDDSNFWMMMNMIL